MKLIIGLGNPGKKYAGTRHNVGFDAVDQLAKSSGATWTKDAKRKAETATTAMDGVKITLAKPTTFMNDSGTAVQQLASYYKVPLDNILVIHDDMDLAVGRVKYTHTSGPAGHNGVADIHEKLATKNIPRIRVGVGRPEPPMTPEAWVLTTPTGEDRKKIQETLTNVTTEVIPTWVKS